MTKKFPYNKDKQQAYQAAEQGYEEAKDVYQSLDRNSGDYGHQLKRLEQEIREAEQQIENAHEVASETQRKQLYEYQTDLSKMNQELQ